MSDAIQPSDLAMPLDELMAFAAVSEDDIQAAIDWWNENASETWKGALDEQAGTGSAGTD